MAGFVRVRNWEKFQHYKDRNPPWIKLHTELLDHYEFSCLQDASKLLAMCTWLLAARSDNRIPADPEWIKQRCNLKTKPDLKPLIAAGFLEVIQELQSPEQVASKPLAERLQDASKVLLRGEERRGETEGASKELAGRVFGHWREVHGHPKAVLDAKRQRLIESRLQDFTADDLMHAIEGYKCSPFHQGQNDRHQVYDSLELMLRENAQVEQGLKFYKPIEEQENAPALLPDGRDNPAVVVNGHRVRSFIVGPEGQIGQNIKAVVWEGDGGRF